MHLELDYERFTKEEYEIARILTSQQVSELFDKLVMPEQQRHDSLPLSASSDERAVSMQAVNKAQDGFDVERLQIWNKAAALYCDVRQGKVDIPTRCPDGFKLVNQRMDIDTLRNLAFYPGERMIDGIATEPGKHLGAPDDKLLAEVRPQETRPPLLYPSGMYYHAGLAGKDGMSSEDNELVNFLYKHPNVIDGIIEADLEDERTFLENLYIEGVPMAQVKEVLLQQPDITQDNLQQILQLYRLKAEGAAVAETNIRLKGIARETADKVMDEFRQIYTGPNRPLTDHPSYTQDIRVKFDADLKRQAELQLRKLGVLQTLPESLDVRWVNTRGDNWEAEQMTHVVNDMFRGYAQKIVDAEQQEEWSRVNIYTTNPEYRKRIMDTLTYSWAKDKIEPVTELQDMPVEIASARQAAMEAKNNSLTPTFIGMNEGVYFSEKGTQGYVYVDYNRNTMVQGEPFTEKNRQYVEQLVKEGNIMRMTSACLKPVGEMHEFLDRMTGHIQVASKELIDGKYEWIEAHTGFKFTGGSCYSDITGRVTDAKVIEKDDKLYIRCKIDGVQQMAQKMKKEDVLTFNEDTDLYKLAVQYFKGVLQEEQNREQGMKR